ncbi:MAG: PAS domain S-box protein [Bacteroidales bacterium]
MKVIRNLTFPGNNFLLYFILLTLILIASFLIHETNRYGLKKQLQQEFKYTAQNKAEEIRRWYEAEKNAVSFFQQTTFFARGLYEYVKNPHDTKLEKQIEERLKATNRNGKYANIFIIDTTTNVIFSLDKEEQQLDRVSQTAIRESFIQNKISFVNIYQHSKHHAYFMEFVVPISLAGQKTPFVSLLFRIRPENGLFPLLDRWPLLSNSARIYLVRTTNDMLVILNRKYNDSLLELSLNSHYAEVMAFLHPEKVIDGIDYRKNNVSAISIPIDKMGWYLLVKVNQDELYAPLINRRNVFVLLTIVIVILITIGYRLLQINQEKFYFKKLLQKEQSWNNQLKEYRTILYSIGDGVITTDREGNITMMNAVAEQLTGFTEQDALRQPLTSIFRIANEYTLEPVETPIEKVIREKRVIGLANHTVLIAKSGEIIPIVDSGAPVIDEFGNIQGVVLVFRDQREEKQKEALLRNTEHQYRTLFEAIPDGIALHELIFDEIGQPIDYRIITVNKRYEEIFNISRDRAINALATDLYAAAEPPYLDIYAKVAMEGNPIEFETFFPWLNKYLHISVYCPEKNKFAAVFQDVTEQKLLETERFRLLNMLENSINEIYVFDYNNWHFEYANRGSLRNTGYSIQELSEMTPLELLEGISREDFNQLIKPLKTGEKQTITFEAFHRRKDGSQYPIEAQIQIQQERNHKVFLSIISDITEKRKYKQELAVAEQKYTELFNSITEAIFIHDIQTGDIIDVNQSVVNLYGYSSKQEVIEQCNVGSLSDSERDYTQEKALALIQKTVKEGPQHVEWLAKKKNGETFWMDILLKKIRLGHTDYVIATGRDITLEKQIRLALDESNERFRLAFLTSPDAVNINRMSDGLYVEVNEGFCKITGYTRQEVIGKTSLQLNIWANPDDRARLVNELKEKGYCENFEAQFRCKDGSVITGLMSARIIMLKNVPHILNITRDISSRIEMEKQLIEAKNKAEESDRLKTAFLHNISHEIRTPMNAIMGFADLLKNEELAPERRTKYLDIIINSSKQLLSIVNDVLEISRLESRTVPLHFSTFNLNHLAEELYHLFLPRIRNLKFSFHCGLPIEKAFIEGDKEKINQILTNLLNNALKFTQEGSIEFGYNIENDNLVWYVRDTGMGIPENEQDKIFERFYQANLAIAQLKGGSGLGLSIVKNLVELMGGHIWLESVPGQGSTFYVKLPYKPAKSKLTTHTPMPVSLQDLYILVVEDNISNFDLIEHLLTQHGARISWAKTGAEALEKIRANRYNLVLMDIKLPEMDGITATRLIKQNNPHLPVIAVTAYSTPEDRQEALDAGCDAFLTKPVEKNALLDIIQALSQSAYQ